MLVRVDLLKLFTQLEILLKFHNLILNNLTNFKL